MITKYFILLVFGTRSNACFYAHCEASGFVCTYNLCFLGQDLTYSLFVSKKKPKDISVHKSIYANANVYMYIYISIPHLYITPNLKRKGDAIKNTYLQYKFSVSFMVFISDSWKSFSPLHCLFCPGWCLMWDSQCS